MHRLLSGLLRGALGAAGALIISPTTCLMMTLLGLSSPGPSVFFVFWLIGLALVPIVGAIGGIAGAAVASRQFGTNKAAVWGSLIGGGVGGILFGILVGLLGWLSGY